jgi:hypothetical protein
MSIHAANPAAPPHLCLCVVEQVVGSLAACNGGGGARRLQPRESGRFRLFLLTLGSLAVRRASTLKRFPK